jgi:hypothetical protein
VRASLCQSWLLVSATASAGSETDHRGHGLEIIVDAQLRWQGQLIADPEGLGPGASASVGARNGWGGQVSWSYSRYSDTYDEFSDQQYEHRVHYVTAGATRRTAIDHWSVASVGFGVALTHDRQNPPMEPSSAFHAGVWIDARLGLDVLELGRHQAITLGVAITLLVVSPVAGAASVGIGYHWR